MKASEAYQEQQTLVIANLWTIRKLLVNMDEVQAATPQYWTHEGSLKHINSELADIIRFMGGREA